MTIRFRDLDTYYQDEYSKQLIPKTFTIIIPGFLQHITNHMLAEKGLSQFNVSFGVNMNNYQRVLYTHAELTPLCWFLHKLKQNSVKQFDNENQWRSYLYEILATIDNHMEFIAYGTTFKSLLHKDYMNIVYRANFHQASIEFSAVEKEILFKFGASINPNFL